MKEYCDRTIELMKKWEGRDINILESAIIFMETEIRRRRERIVELDRGIIELYEDITTLDFLIRTNKDAK